MFYLLIEIKKYKRNDYNFNLDNSFKKYNKIKKRVSFRNNKE